MAPRLLRSSGGAVIPLQPGLTLIGDKGFAGQVFEDLVTGGFEVAYGPPGPPRRGTRHGPIGWIRQWIESVNDTLNGQLGLERHGGRTTEGLYARIAQRLRAMAAAFRKRSLIAYDS